MSKVFKDRIELGELVMESCERPSENLRGIRKAFVGPWPLDVFEGLDSGKAYGRLMNTDPYEVRWYSMTLTKVERP